LGTQDANCRLLVRKHAQLHQGQTITNILCVQLFGKQKKQTERLLLLLL
jgi:hypothetical protein